MRKLIFLFFVSLFILSSCEDDEMLTKSFTDFTFVSFVSPDETLTIQEDNVGETKIPFTLSVAQDSDVVVSLIIEDSTAVQGTHFSVINSSVTVPAGQLSGSFSITTIDDESFNESRAFNISMTTDFPGVVVGLSGNTSTLQKTIVLVNDDCPTNYSIWFGALSIEDVGFGSTPGTGSANSTGTCDILRVNNDLPAIGSATNTIYEVILTPDFDGSTSGSAEVKKTVARTGIANEQFGPLSAVYSSTGFYDEITKEITLEYTVEAVDAAGTTVGQFYTGTNVIRLAN